MKKARQESAGKGICNVCFVGVPSDIAGDTHRGDAYADLVMLRCKGCKLECHRCCYNSQLPNGDFTCDYCLQVGASRNKPAKVCFLCKGPGYLMKRVGEQGFAHPICLLESPHAVVRSYQTLEFESVRIAPVSTEPKQICQLCERPSELVHKCSNKSCKKVAHLICIVRAASEEDSTREWTYFFGPNIYVLRMRQQSVKLQPGDLKAIRDSPIGTHRAELTVECPEHPQSPCVCTDPRSSYPIRNTDPTTEVAWLACDMCKGWYHRECLKFDDPKFKMKAEYKTFKCKYCKDWTHLKRKGETYQNPYPKFQLPDVIYIMKQAEKQQERVAYSLLESLPFPVFDTTEFRQKSKATETRMEIEKEPKGKEVEIDKQLERKPEVAPAKNQEFSKKSKLNAEKCEPPKMSKSDFTKMVEQVVKPQLPLAKPQQQSTKAVAQSAKAVPERTKSSSLTKGFTKTSNNADFAKTSNDTEFKTPPTKQEIKQAPKLHIEKQSSERKETSVEKKPLEKNVVHIIESKQNTTPSRAPQPVTRETSIKQLGESVERLLPLINLDHPEKHEEFIEKEGLLDRARAVLGKAESTASNPNNKRAKKRVQTEYLEDLKDLLRQIQRTDPVSRSIQQLVADPQQFDQKEYVLAVQRLILSNRQLLERSDVSTRDVYSKLLLEVKQSQTCIPAVSNTSGQKNPLLSFVKDPSLSAFSEMTAFDSLKQLYGTLLARFCADTQISSTDSHLDNKGTKQASLANQLLAQLYEAVRRCHSYEQLVAEETHRVGQFLQKNGYFTTEEYSRLNIDCQKRGLTQCLQRNNLQEPNYYHILKLEKEAQSILCQPLSKRGCRDIQRLICAWNQSLIRPTEERQRECSNYLLQCRLLGDIEAHLHIMNEDYQGVIARALQNYREQPTNANYLRVDLEILCRKRVELRGDMMTLVQLIGQEKLKHARNTQSTLTAADVNRYIRLSKYLRLYHLEEQLKSQAVKYKEWLVTKFMPIDNWAIEERLNELDFVKAHERDLADAYESWFELEFSVSGESEYLFQLQLWFRMAKKAHSFLNCTGKITTHAIKELQKWMNEGKFPRNRLMAEVVALAGEAAKVESQVEKFTGRRRKVEEHNELSLVNRKPTQRQANELIEQLKQSRFDMQFRIDDINDELARFNKKCRDVERVLQNRRLDEVSQTVKFFVDGPICYDRFKELWEVWIDLKCVQGKIRSRSQLTTLLNVAVEHEDTLRRRYKQTMETYECYDKLVQASSSSERSNECVSVETLTEMRSHLLRDDVHEKGTITNWIGTFTTARNSYLSDRRFTKEELQKLAMCMQRCPIKNLDIELDIRSQRDKYDRITTILNEVSRRNEPLTEREIEDCGQYITQLETSRLTSDLIQSMSRHLANYNLLAQMEQSLDSIATRNFDFFAGLLNRYSGLIRAFCTRRIEIIRQRLLDIFMPRVMPGPPLDASTIRNLIKQIGYLLEGSELQDQERYTAWRKELKKMLGDEAAHKQALSEPPESYSDEGSDEDDMLDQEEEDDEMEDEEEYEEDDVSEVDVHMAVPVKKPKPNEIVVLESDEDDQ